MVVICLVPKRSKGPLKYYVTRFDLLDPTHPVIKPYKKNKHILCYDAIDPSLPPQKIAKLMQDEKTCTIGSEYTLHVILS